MHCFTSMHDGNYIGSVYPDINRSENGEGFFVLFFFFTENDASHIFRSVKTEDFRLTAPEKKIISKLKC